MDGEGAVGSCGRVDISRIRSKGMKRIKCGDEWSERRDEGGEKEERGYRSPNWLPFPS